MTYSMPSDWNLIDLSFGRSWHGQVTGMIDAIVREVTTQDYRWVLIDINENVLDSGNEESFRLATKGIEKSLIIHDWNDPESWRADPVDPIFITKELPYAHKGIIRGHGVVNQWIVIDATASVVARGQENTGKEARDNVDCYAKLLKATSE